MKKVLSVLLVILIIFAWVFTLTDTFGVGPLKDRIKLGLDLSGGVYVVMEAKTDAEGEELKKLMDQTQAIIEDRVNQMGLSEPVVTIEGDKRIRVELPGADDAEQAIETIGQTAQLQFLLADGTFVLDGSQIKDAGVTRDEENGGYAVSLEFDKDGTDAFYNATSAASSGQVTSTTDGVGDRAIMIVLDGNIISAPNAQGPIPDGNAIITGKFTEKEAVDLALLIRGGALPLELEEVNASEIGATLGLDALYNSVIAGLIGTVLIFILMLVMYRLMGMVANIALLLYIPVVFWIITLMGGVLTLPGIAGIILSIGMAVDANVIIFARIKEEITKGKSVRVAVNSGFKRAMTTIIDSQITTMIAGVVLYQFGSGPVKGFAMTLMIGIVVSIFTAVFVTQLYLSLIADSKFLSQLKFFGIKENRKASIAFKNEFSFIKHRKKYYIVIIAVLVIGLGVSLFKGFNYGIDFTGGTMLQVDMGKKVEIAQVEKVLKANGIDESDVVHYGDGNKGIIIKTTVSLSSDSRQALLDDMYEEFDITSESILSFEQFGPSIGELLKENAIKAIIIAAIGMLIYIIIRFEWKFGVASLAGVVHDVLILIIFYGLFSIPINNPFIAGVLTVVGYSINDTIVVFDRIRENLKVMRKTQLDGLIDKSINQTIVRSLMTSATTILAIIPLYILGGETIRQFTLPLIVGIAAGAASSIFLCSPLYYEIVKMFDKPKYKGKKKQSKTNKKRIGDGAVV